MKGLCQNEAIKSDDNFENHPIKALILIAMVILLFLPLGYVGIRDIAIRRSWSDLSVTPVSDLSQGDVVKLDGYIDESSDYVAIGGTEGKSSRDRYYWRMDQKSAFNFSDNSGSVYVTTKYHYDIEDGPTPAPSRKHTSGTVYMGCDEVIIIGKAVIDENQTSIHLLWMGTNEEDIKPSNGTYIGVASYLLVPFLSSPHYIKSYLKKRKQHYKRVKFVKPIPFESIDLYDEPGLTWRNNASIFHRQAIPFSFTLILCLFTVFSWAIFHLAFHRIYEFMGIAGLIVLFSCVLIYLLSIHIDVFMNPRPVELAFSKRGIYYNYQYSEIQYLEDYLLSWTKIKEFRYIRKAKRGHWAIVLKNDKIIHMNNISSNIK